MHDSSFPFPFPHPLPREKAIFYLRLKISSIHETARDFFEANSEKAAGDSDFIPGHRFGLWRSTGSLRSAHSFPVVFTSTRPKSGRKANFHSRHIRAGNVALQHKKFAHGKSPPVLSIQKIGQYFKQLDCLPITASFALVKTMQSKASQQYNFLSF